MSSVLKHLLGTYRVQFFQPFRRYHRIKGLPSFVTQDSEGSLRTRGTSMGRDSVVNRSVTQDIVETPWSPETPGETMGKARTLRSVWWGGKEAEPSPVGL